MQDQTNKDEPEIEVEDGSISQYDHGQGHNADANPTLNVQVSPRSQSGISSQGSRSRNLDNVREVQVNSGLNIETPNLETVLDRPTPSTQEVLQGQDEEVNFEERGQLREDVLARVLIHRLGVSNSQSNSFNTGLAYL